MSSSDEDVGPVPVGPPWYECQWRLYEFIEIVRQIAEESEKVGYDPEKGTNWCDLPMEMRMKCISEMDFQEKFHLRNTCSLERSLVDSKEMHFDRVKIEFGCEIKAKFWKNEPYNEGYGHNLFDYQFSGYPEHRWQPFKKALRNTARLLKLSTVDTLEIEYEGGFKEMPEIFEMNAPFRIKKIVSDSSREPFVFKPHDFFIDNCEPNVEQIDFLREQCDSFYDGDYYNHKFPLVSSFRMEKLNEEDIHIFLNKWFEDDLRIGTELEIGVRKKGDGFDFILDYAPRDYISGNDSTHRYRTDNEEKELVITTKENEKDDWLQLHTITFKIVAAQPDPVVEKEETEGTTRKRTHSEVDDN